MIIAIIVRVEAHIVMIIVIVRVEAKACMRGMHEDERWMRKFLVMMELTQL